MGRSTVHYADNKTNNALKRLHNKLRPAGTPVQRVEYIIELLLLRIFETKLKQDDEFKPLRQLFSAEYTWLNPKTGQEESNENRLFSYLATVSNDQILAELNSNFFPFYETILQHARRVFTGNLPQKVQDQLVLIEEVFSNSNFTNNVNSGNLGEVVGIVTNDIEESRLLKTDLLGDAIESALSETGGTKDIGLFRTPDHIRQFMTALVEPGVDDLVFDPACGTGGFLFDAFEFVMRRIDPEQTWPGEKAHVELQTWFDEYFRQNQLDFPSIEQTTQFYRSGVAGIEYLGMIRKMAAINFYIRGLNPANIEHGDSLAKFNPAMDAGSKTVVLANPPFGAERDQDAYANVWPEYAKESETTILFVKLMVELLKKGGRCAVVVSEGFHTWDQFSAKALRKSLLDENQLRAVISLPQGLFVSKSGQGPKTSILLFEKGGITDWTWFYKITNDGYTMGTNRKEQPGNQLVECLTLYHQYVKHGKRPPESKQQFCIPAEWIKTLDPRIKAKIRLDTRADLAAKGAIERAKKEADYDRKIKACKLSELEKQIELKQFDHILENRIQNEIAKRIDKAHTYSFNLSNYKSPLSAEQVADWTDALKTVLPNGVATLEEAYKKLQTTTVDQAARYIAKLNPANALEADIVREYVSNLAENVVAEHPELYTLRTLLESGATYPKVKLGTVLTERNEYIHLDDDQIYTQLTMRLWGKGITLRGRQNGADIATKKQSVVRENDILISKIDARNGAFGLVNSLFDGAIVSNEFPSFTVDTLAAVPRFIEIVITSEAFYEQIEALVAGASGRRRLESREFLNLEIPLPTLDQQTAFIAQVDKQKGLIEGVEKVLANWHPSYSKNECVQKRLGEVIELQRGYDLPISQFVHGGHHAVIGSNGVIGSHSEYKYAGPGVVTGRSGTIGKVHYIEEEYWPHNTSLFVKDFKGNNPKFIYYLLQTLDLKSLAENNTAVPSLDRKNAYQVVIDIPTDLETQHQIVAELDAQMKVLDSLRTMKAAAEVKINTILGEVWGVTPEPATVPTEA